MRQRIVLIQLILMVFCAAVAALPEIATAETVIKIGGTGSALGTMTQLARLYEKSHPEISIRILPSLGSSAGIKATLDGGLDLGISSRPLTESERHQGATAEEYAQSPFVFITNLNITKKNISIRELERMYANPNATWPDGSRIRLILRPEKEIDTKLLRGISPGMDKAMTAAMARPGMIMATTNQESTTALAMTPGAFACATLSEIISENRPVNVLSLNGVKPTLKAISDKSYPIAKSFYLVTTLKTTHEARKFASFIHSPEADMILMKTGNSVVKAKKGK